MSISQRWLPGGDKFEQHKADVSRAWWQRVDEEMETILGTMKADVSTWTEEQIENGYQPVFEKFIEEYPEWDHEAFYDAIEAEMNRVTAICMREAK